MTGVHTTHNSESIVTDIYKSFAVVFREHPLVAGVLWAGVFAVLFSVSWMLGIVPTIESDTEAPADVTVTESTRDTSNTADARPVRIIADAIDLDSPISTPASRDIEVLDQALLSGVVHYPGSANLGDLGDVFLFGHSTGFRVVQNEAYKVFNGLKNLKERDLIRVQSTSREYVYRVVSVTLTTADDAIVDLSHTGRRLTLSTCNSFGAKQERYVVEAEFVGDYAL